MPHVTDLLNLPGYRVCKVDETDTQYTIHAETTDPKFRQCCLLADLVSNGPRRRCFRDTLSHNKFVDVWVTRRRRRCKQCKSVVDEDLPHVHPHHDMTIRLFDAVVQYAKAKPYAEVARMFGLTDVTVRNALNTYIDEKLANYSFPTPRVMGIDEKFLLGKYRAVVGNIETRTMLDMRPDRFKGRLGQYLERLENRDRIEVFCQDMYANYRTVARKKLPKAVVVVDKFHVVMKANDAVEKFRRTLNSQMDKRERSKLKNQRLVFLARYQNLKDESKETLERWFAAAPALEDVYWLKERFYDFYSAKTREQAEARYERWLTLMKPEYEPFFAPLMSSMTNWRAEILNYFDHPYTNNYVESLNRTIDDLNRAGRGYEFEMIRAKALLTQGIHKTAHPKFRRGEGVSSFGPWEGLEDFSLGVDLNLLSAATRMTKTEFTYVGDQRFETVIPGLSTLEGWDDEGVEAA